MSRICYIYSHKPASKAAKQLSRHLLVHRIKHTDSRFRGRKSKTVINWGSSYLPPEVEKCNVLNPPEDIASVQNKLLFFEELKGHHLTPGYTTDVEKATAWLKKGTSIVCRSLLNASGGRGIHLATKPEEMYDAPLYVRYAPKQDEYRVHIFDGEVIDVQKKALKIGTPSPNWKVRNLDGGFIYAREGLDVPPCVTTVATSCFSCFPLTFGAVDVIYTANRDQALVLEINTAPGLMGSTILAYGSAIKKHLGIGEDSV